MMVCERQIGKKTRTALFILATLAFSGCFAVGIPEYTAPLTQKIEADGKAALIIAPPPRDKSFGTQFVFGVIPFTRIYFQHSAETFLVEHLMTQLELKGFTVYTTDEQSGLDVARTISPALIVSPSWKTLNFTTYDAFFLRILSFSAEISLQFSTIKSEKLLPARELLIPIQKTSYRNTAFGSVLTSILSRETGDALAAELPDSRTQRMQKTRLENQTSPVVFITPPNLSLLPTSDIEKLGEIFAQSYGFRSEAPLERGQFARLMTRGILEALSESGIHSATTTSAFEQETPAQAWILYSTAREFSFQGEGCERSSGDNCQLILSFDFRLKSENGGTLAQGTHQTVTSPPNDVDGTWIVALETASAELARMFFRQDQSAS